MDSNETHVNMTLDHDVSCENITANFSEQVAKTTRYHFMRMEGHLDFFLFFAYFLSMILSNCITEYVKSHDSTIPGKKKNALLLLKSKLLYLLNLDVNLNSLSILCRLLVYPFPVFVSMAFLKTRNMIVGSCYIFASGIYMVKILLVKKPGLIESQEAGFVVKLVGVAACATVVAPSVVGFFYNTVVGYAKSPTIAFLSDIPAEPTPLSFHMIPILVSLIVLILLAILELCLNYRQVNTNAMKSFAFAGFCGLVFFFANMLTRMDEDTKPVIPFYSVISVTMNLSVQCGMAYNCHKRGQGSNSESTKPICTVERQNPVEQPAQDEQPELEGTGGDSVQAETADQNAHVEANDDDVEHGQEEEASADEPACADQDDANSCSETSRVNGQWSELTGNQHIKEEGNGGREHHRRDEDNEWSTEFEENRLEKFCGDDTWSNVGLRADQSNGHLKITNSSSDDSSPEIELEADRECTFRRGSHSKIFHGHSMDFHDIIPSGKRQSLTSAKISDQGCIDNYIHRWISYPDLRNDKLDGGQRGRTALELQKGKPALLPKREVNHRDQQFVEVEIQHANKSSVEEKETCKEDKA